MTQAAPRGAQLSLRCKQEMDGIQDTLIDNLGKLLTTFKEAHVEHMGYTQATHGIVAASFFLWLGDEAAANELEEENMN